MQPLQRQAPNVSDAIKVVIASGVVVVGVASAIYGPQVIIKSCIEQIKQQITNRVVPFIQQNLPTVLTGAFLLGLYHTIKGDVPTPVFVRIPQLTTTQLVTPPGNQRDQDGPNIVRFF